MLIAMSTSIWIVSGSSRGLGLAIAMQLLQSGQRVLGLARHTNPALQARATAQGADLTQWAIDLAAPVEAATRLRQWLQGQDSTPVDRVTLINNAGVISTPAPLAGSDLAELSNALRVGLESALLLTSAFLQATDRWPAARRVLNVSSGLGRRAMASSAAYCAAKAGMDHFSRAVALEQALHANGARIESMAPGVIDTDMQAQLRDADADLFPDRGRFLALQAGGQLLSAADCAAMTLARLERAEFGADPVTDIRD